MDRKVILTRVGGDVQLMREIIALFLNDYPRLLRAVREAIARADGPKLKRAAHTLKGSVGNFAAAAAFDAAYRLERLGRDGDWAGVPEGLACLEREMDRLLPALAALAQETRIEDRG